MQLTNCDHYCEELELVSERKRRFFEKTFKNQIALEIILAIKLGKIISNRQLANKF